MSKKSVFKQPGIEQLIPGAELPVAVKVTGRNMHAASLLLSQIGEANGARTTLSAFFKEDGALSHVTLTGPQGETRVEAGEYLLLSDDKKILFVADKSYYELTKGFFKALSSVEAVLESFAASLSNLL